MQKYLKFFKNMKYKVGDKVKYDSDEWCFYGSVSAIIENSICPCYRLTVEQVVKKNCRFSITQFEFELESDNEDNNVNNKRKWESEEIKYIKNYYENSNKEDLSIQVKSEPGQTQPLLDLVQLSEPKKTQKIRQSRKLEIIEPSQKKEHPNSKKSELWDTNFELYQNGERSVRLYNWITNNRRLYKAGNLREDRLKKLKGINFPFESERKKVKVAQDEQKSKNNSWDANLELYLNGVRTNAIYTWMSLNRRLNKTGKLNEYKLNKLKEIDFPFDIMPRQKKEGIRREKITKEANDNWGRNLKKWKKGERDDLLQLWRQKSVRLFVDGKLPQDRIEKLKEVGILK